jgi:polysaccharide biosynthesis transport protein
MLDTRDLPAPAAARPTNGSEVDLRGIWEALKRNRRIFFGVLFVAVVLGLLLTALLPRVYQSEAVMRIEGERPGINILPAVLPTGIGQLPGLTGSDDLQTDIAALQSRAIAEAVVDSLALHVVVLEPGPTRAGVIRVLEAPRVRRGAIYRLTLGPGGTYSVRAEGPVPAHEVPGEVAIGRPFRLGEVTLALDEVLSSQPPERIRIAIRPFQGAVGELRRYTTVSRPSPGASMVSIRYRSRDPELAAAVPNVQAVSFIRYKNLMNRSESRSTVDFLEEQAAGYAAELREAESRLQQFRESSQIIEPTVQATEQVRRLALIQAEHDALRVEQQALRRVLAEVEAASRPAGGPSPYRRLAAYPTLMTNGSVQEILRILIELENQQAELLVRRTETDRDVQALGERIAELEAQLFRMTQNFLSGVDDRIAALETALGRFGAEIERVPAAEVEFFRLTRDQRLLEQIYTLIQTNLKEAEIQAASEPARVQVLDRALVPEQPTSPSLKMNLALAILLGMVGGVVGALARGYTDPRVRTPQDVWNATGGLPILATITPLRVGSTNDRPGRISWPRRVQALPAPGGALVLRDRPGSVAAEAYRHLRTSLTHGGERSPGLVVVTSPSREGTRSEAAANLALALAQQGAATILLDADLRGGELHRLFGLAEGAGLAEVLRDRTQLSALIRHVESGNGGSTLHLVPAGAPPRNPTELLGTPEARELLRELRRTYDAVVIVAPPLDGATDAAVLGMIADMTVVSVRCGSTERRALERAVASLTQLGVAVRGVILTNSGEGAVVAPVPALPAFVANGSGAPTAV